MDAEVRASVALRGQRSDHGSLTVRSTDSTRGPRTVISAGQRAGSSVQCSLCAQLPKARAVSWVCRARRGAPQRLTETRGGPGQAEDTGLLGDEELGRLYIDTLLILVHYIDSGLRLRAEWEEGRKGGVFLSTHSPAPHSERPESCRPSLLGKLPNHLWSQRDSCGSPLHPKCLVQDLLGTLVCSLREALVRAAFPSPCISCEMSGT